MKEQIKPKQCGETAWYIPNQKGFVPERHETFWACTSDYNVVSFVMCGISTYYALIDAGNCFETRQEAFDAFVKPVDPTPLTWSELCEIADISEGDDIVNKGPDEMVALIVCFRSGSDKWVDSYGLEYACTVRRKGRLNFEVNKYWRSKESQEAWIKKQKGEWK